MQPFSSPIWSFPTTVNPYEIDKFPHWFSLWPPIRSKVWSSDWIQSTCRCLNNSNEATLWTKSLDCLILAAIFRSVQFYGQLQVMTKFNGECDAFTTVNKMQFGTVISPWDWKVILVKPGYCGVRNKRGTGENLEKAVDSSRREQTKLANQFTQSIIDLPEKISSMQACWLEILLN